jgi:hypothetical protein
MHAERPESLWSALSRPQQAGAGMRIILSLISGLVCSAGAMVGAWCYSMRVGRSYVTDDCLGISFALAGLVWMAFLGLVWRGMARGVRIGRAIGATIVIWLNAIAFSVWLDRAIIGQEEYLIGGIVLLAGAITIYAWAPILLGLGAKKPVISPEDLVNVECPSCGYSLIGLRELRCPECGAGFAIDELIRAQRYEGAKPRRLKIG